MSEDYLSLPEITTDPPKGHADCYHDADPSGVYRMTREAELHIARCRAEIAELGATLEFERARERVALDETRERLRDRLIDGAIASALGGKVNRKFVPAVVAMLRDGWEFETNGEAVNVTRNGATIPVQSAVEAWASSESAAPFLDRKPATPESKFSNLIKQITQ